MAYAGFCQWESLLSLFEGAYRVGDTRVPGNFFSNQLRRNHRRKTATPLPSEKMRHVTNQWNNFSTSRKRF